MKDRLGLLRFPGGQDGQQWGWASCETRTELVGALPCERFGWVARPSEFIGFLRAVGGEAVVTVNVNATAKENAAFVAFMNGHPEDTRVIGMDHRGADWKTVGYWAQRRADAGHPEPVNVTLWEFGNETYGGIFGKSRCIPEGWEVTYTCDPGEYLDGLTTPAIRYDGYRATRAAMKSVDSRIQLGATLVDPKEEYNGWSRDLVRLGVNDIDFFSVHPYFTWVPPPNTKEGNAQILAMPQSHWKGLADRIKALLATHGGGRHIPILASEYNLTPGTANDTAMRTNKVINGFLMADSVGVMAKDPAFIGGNQFEFFGGPQADGSWFALVRNDESLSRTPQYWGLHLWSKFGSQLTHSESTFDAAKTLSVHTGRDANDSLTLYAINKSLSPVTAQVSVDGSAGIERVVADAITASSLDDIVMSVNGVTSPRDDLSDAPPSVRVVGGGASSFDHTFPPLSLSLLRIVLGSPGTATPTSAQPPLTTSKPTATTSPQGTPTKPQRPKTSAQRPAKKPRVSKQKAR